MIDATTKKDITPSGMVCIMILYEASTKFRQIKLNIRNHRPKEIPITESKN